MGTWGAGFFDCDLALDCREALRERFARGADGARAARDLVREWRESFDDPEDGAVLWLALADAAWEAGRLRALDPPARLTRIAYDPWGHMPVWFYVTDLARKADPGRRYYVWPEKHAPKRAVERGFGPITTLGAPLEGLIARELGISQRGRR
jgi:hypothetical protein